MLVPVWIMHREPALLAAAIDAAQGLEPFGVGVGGEELVRRVDLEAADAQVEQAVDVAFGVAW